MSALHPSSDEIEIRGVLREMQRAWTEGRYDDLRAWLDEEVLIAPPRGARRIRGAGPYAASYRDFDEAADTLEFTPAEPEIDVMGEIAVARCPFRMVYVMQGRRHEEEGVDLLVLSRAIGAWRVVWRTVQSSEV
ncbi:MAG: DUF4440 domain-containing protein [Planctomycetota bacterium]